MNQKITSLLKPYLDQGLLTDAFLAVGDLDADSGWELSIGSHCGGLFDLASLTKALFISPLYYYWHQLGVHDLNAPIQGIKTLDLLSHTSGLCDWRPLWIACQDHLESVDAHIDMLVRQRRDTGSYVYSDIGYILLGMQAKKIQPLAKLFESLCGFLDVRVEGQAGFAKHISSTALFVPTAQCPLRARRLQGEVHDENAWFLGGEAGHSGLFATGPWLHKYLKKLCQQACIERLINESQGGLRIWQKSGPSGSDFYAGQCWGHYGFTGTSFFIEPRARKYIILLTNAVYSERRPKWIAPLRKALTSLLASSI